MANEKAQVTNRRLQVVTLGSVVALTVGLMVAASLYKFVGGALQSFSDETSDVYQQIAFCFGLFMPLLSYGVTRRARFLPTLAFQGTAAIIWIVMLVGAFAPVGETLGLVSIILVCAYLLAVAGFNLVFSFTVSWYLKVLYVAVAVVASAGALAAYAVGTTDSTEVYVVAAGMLVATALTGVASYFNRTIEAETANAAVFGSRVSSAFYLWGSMLYFAIAVLAVPLTILIDRPSPVQSVELANYVILGVSLLVAIALLIVAKLKWIGAIPYAMFASANVIAATAATLLIGSYSSFLDAVDSLFVVGIYLVAVFLLIILFAPAVPVSRSFTVVRNILSWYGASALGIVVMLVATHSENALATAFMPLHTFIIFLFLLGLSVHFGAMLLIYAARMRARRANPLPLKDPTSVVEEK